ncbi:phosphoglucomutase [Oceanotoga teriensis]|uniref:Phosphoglucomutase n=1 Tax=Oceanotoga teriensis TaxID=515440 RepID=A0AA45HJ72_9BACT|nr:phospho-sugar mutase [Oceanotoga teriensis]PWJ95868.1 phosphoglucomutase [Oceanotoga teriensis]
MKDLKVISYEKLNEWIEKTEKDVKDELEKIKTNEDEILDRFYKDLEFGTGGMRGKMGAGSNRMNIYTVARATQGFANYIKSKKDFPSVVIAYDNRNMSPEFSKIAAQVFAGNGIRVYLFPELTATPILSYAVRHLSADGGIVITASHNPPEYNGYKVYTSDGTQAVPKYAKMIIEEVNKLDYFNDIKIMNYDEAVEQEKIKILDDELFNDYIDEIEGYIRSIDPSIKRNLDITYTPLHGTGLKPVEEILSKLGFNVNIVKEQAIHDGNFPTVKSPNPEEKKAFDMALKLAKETNSELVLATDPDADRIGVFEKNGNDYVTFNGNEMGIMLSHFLLTNMKEHAILPKNGVIIKTIVSTEMIKPMAKEFGIEVEETLTGFKFIGEKMEYYDQTKTKKFLFGFEESYGCLANNHARDKDAVIASALIATLKSKLKQEKKTLKEYLQELNEKYGFYKEKLLSYTFEGIQGNQKISKLMKIIKEEPPAKLNNAELFETVDYNSGINGLPKSNVIELRYENIKIIARPSGTEPKIKFYLMAKGSSFEEAMSKIDFAEKAVSEIVNKI